MRVAPLLVVLAPLAASAHVVTFDFVAPDGIGTRTDGGFTALQWVDGSDPAGLAQLMFYAARTGVPPFAAAPRDVQLGAAPIPVNDPANLLLWDATRVPPGCYQPFAVVQDQIEGETIRPAAGIVTVAPADGGNLPPALWVLNADTEKPTDGGMFALRLKVDDPDDVGEVTVRWSNGADAGGTIVAGLPTNDGGGTLTYAFSSRGLPPASTYYLQVEVKAFDGQTCQVWWSGNLPGNAPRDGGLDAGGADAGVADAGVGVPPIPRGCGCGQAGAPLMFAAVLVRRRRRLC